jgi:HSP20 family molecular chaperone IbpA
MEYGLSGPSQQGIGETRFRSVSGSPVAAAQPSELQWALARGAGELRDLERRIQRIQASTERVLVSSRGLVPAYSPLAAEIAEAAEEAQRAQQQIGSARAFLENTAEPMSPAGAFAATGSVAGLSLTFQGARSAGLAGGFIRQPALEIWDNGKEFLVRAELPGMTKEDIEVQAAEGSLHVVAEQENETIEAGQLVSAERLAKEFERTVSLPDYVVPSKAVAAFRDGVLEVTLPKKHPGEPAQRLTLK